MATGDYFIGGYCWLLFSIIFVVSGGYYIIKYCGYFVIGYWWLLMVIGYWLLY